MPRMRFSRRTYRMAGVTLLMLAGLPFQPEPLPWWSEAAVALWVWIPRVLVAIGAAGVVMSACVDQVVPPRVDPDGSIVIHTKDGKFTVTQGGRVIYREGRDSDGELEA